MIAPVEAVYAPRPAESTLPVSMEHIVCCGADVDFAVRAIVSAMKHYPFGVFDGLAIQLGVSEALIRILNQIKNRQIEAALRLQTTVTPAFVRVQIDDLARRAGANGFSDQEQPGILPAELSRQLQFTKTYMTSIEIRQAGRQIVLHRARGQGSTISTLPYGYDFQI